MIELTGEKESRHLMVMQYFGKLKIIEIGRFPGIVRMVYCSTHRKIDFIFS